MIEAKKINGKIVYINPHLIESIEVIENNPDTRINFITGKLLVVRDSAEELIQKIKDYRRQIGIEINEPKKTD